MDSMINTNYTHHVEDILKQFSEEEIISLCTTITGGLLKNKIHSRQDAVKAIIGYSEDPQSILRRKLFTKDKLLAYLYEKEIPIRLPINKPEIIKKILILWKYDSGKFEQKPNYGSNDCDPSSEESSIMNDDSIDINFDSLDEQGEYPVETEGHSRSLIVHKDNEVHIGSEVTSVQNNIFALANQFSEWFFNILNNNELSGDHFFPDATLNLVLTSEEVSDSSNIFSDPVGIANCLLETKNKYELYFNPNLSSEGIKGKMDPHGLVMIMAHGTLHSKNICVGVFEQIFALARDPFAENNWKVKRTDLKLKSNNSSHHPPKLCYTNTNSTSDNMLEIT